MKIYQDIHSAYLGTLADVYDNPDYVCSPRGLEIREKLDYQFRILNPIAESIVTHDLERNKVIADYTAKECELYNSCSNKVEDFEKASKFWSKLANPDGTITSSYGYLIYKNKSHGSIYEHYKKDEAGNIIKPTWNDVTGTDYKGQDITMPGMRTPFEWCVQALKADKDTRQAILRFSLPEHFWVGTKDLTCTMHGDYLIRDNKLNFSIVMRANDLEKGLVYDLSFFISLMDKMVEELKPVYPELTKGYYTHTVHSIHSYKRDEEKILKMLGRV